MDRDKLVALLAILNRIEVSGEHNLNDLLVSIQMVKKMLNEGETA